jgi:hypothetical protein
VNCSGCAIRSCLKSSLRIISGLKAGARIVTHGAELLDQVR